MCVFYTTDFLYAIEPIVKALKADEETENQLNYTITQLQLHNYSGQWQCANTSYSAGVTLLLTKPSSSSSLIVL